MEDLAEMVDENGECVVENFTVGRKGNARPLATANLTCLIFTLFETDDSF